MAQGTPLWEIPVGAKCIVSSTNATGTFFTGTLGRRVHIIAAWISNSGSGVTGTLTLSVDVEGSSNLEILGITAPVGTATSTNNSISGIDVPFINTGTVTLNIVTATGLSRAGFIGWEEPLDK